MFSRRMELLAFASRPLAPQMLDHLLYYICLVILLNPCFFVSERSGRNRCTGIQQQQYNCTTSMYEFIVVQPRAQQSTAKHSTVAPRITPCTNQQKNEQRADQSTSRKKYVRTYMLRPVCFPGAWSSWHLQVASLCTSNVGPSTYYFEVHLSVIPNNSSLRASVAGETASYAKRLVRSYDDTTFFVYLERATAVRGVGSCLAAPEVLRRIHISTSITQLEAENTRYRRETIILVSCYRYTVVPVYGIRHLVLPGITRSGNIIAI